MLLLRGSYTGSGKLGDAFDLDLPRDVLETKTGAALVSRLLLLGAAALFIAVLFGAYAQARSDDDGEEEDLTFGLAIGGTVVAAGLAATWALSEHASTGIQPASRCPSTSCTCWPSPPGSAGSPRCSSRCTGRPYPIERAAVRRFSRVAFGSVVVLAATGIYQSWRQVGSWSALTGTSYGQLLLVKVGLVVVLVGVAWISRRWTAQLAEAPAAVETTEAKRIPRRMRSRGGEGAGGRARHR